MVDKFKPAGREQWDNFAVQLCARGRKLNLGWKLRDGHTCRNRFDKLIPKQKSTGSTDVPDIILEAMRVKEAVEEHLFCGAFADSSPDSASLRRRFNCVYQQKSTIYPDKLTSYQTMSLCRTSSRE